MERDTRWIVYCPITRYSSVVKFLLTDEIDEITPVLYFFCNFETTLNKFLIAQIERN